MDRDYLKLLPTLVTGAISSHSPHPKSEIEVPRLRAQIASNQIFESQVLSSEPRVDIESKSGKYRYQLELQTSLGVLKLVTNHQFQAGTVLLLKFDLQGKPEIVMPDTPPLRAAQLSAAIQQVLSHNLPKADFSSQWIQSIEANLAKLPANTLPQATVERIQKLISQNDFSITGIQQWTSAKSFPIKEILQQPQMIKSLLNLINQSTSQSASITQGPQPPATASTLITAQNTAGNQPATAMTPEAVSGKPVTTEKPATAPPTADIKSNINTPTALNQTIAKLAYSIPSLPNQVVANSSKSEIPANSQQNPALATTQTNTATNNTLANQSQSATSTWVKPSENTAAITSQFLIDVLSKYVMTGTTQTNAGALTTGANKIPAQYQQLLQSMLAATNQTEKAISKEPAHKTESEIFRNLIADKVKSLILNRPETASPTYSFSAKAATATSTPNNVGIANQPTLNSNSMTTAILTSSAKLGIEAGSKTATGQSEENQLKLPLSLLLYQIQADLMRALADRPDSLALQLQAKAAQIVAQNLVTYGPGMRKKSMPMGPKISSETTLLNNMLGDVRSGIARSHVQVLNQLSHQLAPESERAPFSTMVIPLTLPGLTEQATLEIKQKSDESDSSKPSKQRQWHLRLHFELKPLPPCCAEIVFEPIAQTSGKLSLIFWSKDSLCLQLFNQYSENLEASLRQKGFEVSECQGKMGLPERAKDKQPESSNMVDIRT